MTLQERIEQLKKIRSKLPETLSGIAKNATICAVEKATDLTPPVGDDLSGTNTQSGDMKQHWAADSKINPAKRNEEFVTELNNDKQYASYVNDGHRMDRHFVPGLVVNPYSGMLEYNPDGKGGIVVGTKTSYVPGLFMVEAGKEEYQKSVKMGVKDLEEMMK